MLKTIHRRANEFIHSQSGGGIVLALAALFALIISNSPWGGWYEQLLQVRGEIRIGGDWLVLSGSGSSELQLRLAELQPRGFEPMIDIADIVPLHEDDRSTITR